ncbi:DNA polymerase III, epsilon subunit [Magnetococcus marinus MC-1]|uniref:DNA polymerase III subunit epsilon n=1 Tax=Magnetococcus marinus (strain ATCC BAA-1437 / JCM 17883 / MC-1) TaxID=156889 RepID=A0L3L4_MAGMM|nr:DNA polymerase III subunit epsilon [Magnetococcus marinus]ABK42557.1 DNA polymerase III, epsilon subunit [Magnetococcus marinus MC-1]
MERLIVLDTETTGFDPKEGHRIIEIGCVELVNMRKGDERQWYVNPEREIPADATKVHGITDADVANSPKFKEIYHEFLAFIGEDSLVIHNAEFDMRFLNAELTRLNKRLVMPMERAIDTIPLARRKFPGSTVNLDALCKRLGVDNSGRTFHGALLDAHLLAEVYVELMGGNQFSLEMAADESGRIAQPSDSPKDGAPGPGLMMAPRDWQVSEESTQAHEAFLQLLDRESGGAVWNKN